MRHSKYYKLAVPINTLPVITSVVQKEILLNLVDGAMAQGQLSSFIGCGRAAISRNIRLLVERGLVDEVKLWFGRPMYQADKE